MKRLITILLLISLSVFSQASHRCIMKQGNGEPYNNAQVQTWVNNNTGVQKFYFDMDSKLLYVWNFNINDWDKVEGNFIIPNIQEVANSGNNLNDLPINFNKGNLHSTIGGDRLFFYHPSGTSEFNGGAMQIYDNSGRYAKIDPNIGFIIKTKGDGINGGNELVLSNSEFTNTRHQQPTDASGKIPVVKFQAPNVGEVGKLGEVRFTETAMFVWTSTGWKTINYNN